MFLDLVYEVNTTPITAQMGVQIMIFLSQLGHYKTKEGKDDYPGTTKMIDSLAEEMKKIILNLTTIEKIDLSISLMVIPIQPALELANLCLENVSATEFENSCFKLILRTDFFKTYENLNPFTEVKDFSIGIIAIYLRTIIKNRPLTKEDFQEKFKEITTNLLSDLESFPVALKWSEITLHNCGKTGRFGPDLETCIKSYNTPGDIIPGHPHSGTVTPFRDTFWAKVLSRNDVTWCTEWSKDTKSFNVDPARRGIQILTIPKTGLYSFDVFGAGNFANTGKGNV